MMNSFNLLGDKQQRHHVVKTSRREVKRGRFENLSPSTLKLFIILEMDYTTVLNNFSLSTLSGRDVGAFI